MSLVIYKQPKLLDFAGNNLFLQIKGTDYLLTQGRYALLSFKTDGAIAFNSLMYLKLMGSTHVFKFADKTLAIPDAVAPVHHIIPISPTSQMTDVVYGLLAYSLLAEYYDITTDNVSVYISAKSTGVAYNIEFDSDHSLPSGINASPSVVTGIDDVVRPNYFFAIKLFVEKMSTRGTYQSLPEFRLDPNASQLIAIDMGKEVRRKFLDFFDLPDFAASTPAKTKYTLLKYYFTAKEMSGRTILSEITTSVYMAINGRVNKSDHQTFDLRTWIVDKKMFLTNMPSNMVVYPGAKAMLYFLNPYAGSTNVVVKIAIALTAGTDITYSYTLTMAQYEVAMIPVDGIITSQVSDLSLLRIADVWVETESGVLLAGKQSYHFRAKQLYGRTVLFQNQYGVFDAITTYEHKNEVKINAEKAIKTLTPDYSRYVGDMAAAHPAVNDMITAETGPVTHAMAQHMKELAASRVVFLAASDRYIRVDVEAGSMSIVDEEKELSNVSFKFSPAFDGDMLSAPVDLPKATHEDYSTEYLKTDYQ